MKNKKIIRVNILIVVIVAAAVMSYAGLLMRREEKMAAEGFVNITNTMEEIVSNYLSDAQRTCNSWANYINANSMTMEEAVEFLRQSITAQEESAHLIWQDSLTGLSTDAAVADASVYTVSYANFGTDIFDGAGGEGAEVHLTRRYTNPMNGRNVIAFYQAVRLEDDNGGESDALLLRVLPISYLEEQWTFPVGYERAQVALMEQHGTYVIQPSVMKNSNFYSFIYSYNKETIDTKMLENFIVSNMAERFYAKNAKGEEMLFVFNHIRSNADWIVVACIPDSDLRVKSMDWTIPVMILAALAIILFIDLTFFQKLRREDKKVQETLSEQLQTICRQEEALKDALSTAVAANSAKSNFLSNMSHDIRTPMNAIVGLCTLLTKDAENPDRVREHTKKIAASSQHLLGLINDVLDMSKIESGKTTLNISEINLAELVNEIVTIIHPQAKAKSQEFDVSVTDMRNEHVLGDKLRINQILINLLSNAVKYTQVGGHILLRITQLPLEKKNYAHYRFVVQDNGCGMSEEYLKVIFEPFTREEKHTISKIQGTGLGMAITKNLVDLVGGTIVVESRQGKGTTFTVDLELRLQDVEIDQEFWTHHGITHALIVDDEVEVCTHIIGAMSGTGVSMQFAVDGRTAVAMTEKALGKGHGFDLILLDWKMPDMDGIETARRIRKVVPDNIPIMILTAYDWSEIEEEAMDAGITGFLPKPFFLTNFMQTVKKIADATKAEESAETENVLEGRRFLVAEDNELNAEILSELLDMMGASVNIVENGQKAVEAFAAAGHGEYDAILMDIQMPVMDGYEATRAIRASDRPDAKDIPIIAMTANAFAEDVKEALDCGMNAHVAKPIDLKRLGKVLREL